MRGDKAPILLHKVAYTPRKGYDKTDRGIPGDKAHRIWSGRVVRRD